MEGWSGGCQPDRIAAMDELSQRLAAQVEPEYSTRGWRYRLVLPLTFTTWLALVKECSRDSWEFMALKTPLSWRDEASLESVLSGWAGAHGHALPDPQGRNPARSLTAVGARAWIRQHLIQGMSSFGKGATLEDAWACADAATELFRVRDAVEMRIVVGDYTFCDLLVMNGEDCACVLAFLADD